MWFYVHSTLIATSVTVIIVIQYSAAIGYDHKDSFCLVGAGGSHKSFDSVAN